jgi:hypothetical protein
MTQNLGAGRPSRKKCQRRNRADARATEIAAEAQCALVREGHRECTDRAIAKSWTLQNHHPVSELFALTNGRCMSLGEPLAMPKELGRRIYVGCLAEVELGGADPAPESIAHLVLDVLHATTTVEQAVRTDPHAHARHRDVFLRLATLAMRGYLASSRGAGGPAR